jgi:hypothetical protein
MAALDQPRPGRGTECARNKRLLRLHDSRFENQPVPGGTDCAVNKTGFDADDCRAGMLYIFQKCRKMSPLWKIKGIVTKNVSF